MKCVCALMAMLGCGPKLYSQTSAKGSQTLHAGTQEVLLDFVARDKHQKLVTDLRPDEVQVYEDGVLQHLNSFRFRDGKETDADSGQKPPRGGNEYDPLRELNLVSIVFESMSAESRQRATEYALEFLNEGVGVNTWTAVFTLNYRLSIVQPYTDDVPLLRAAVRRAGTGEYQTFARESAELLKRINDLQAGTDPGTAWLYQPLSPGSAEEHGPQTGSKELARVLLAVQKATLHNLYEQAGNRAIDSLRNLVRSQALLPGRKTVLFVCEGLVIPPEQPELLRSIISEANHANISFYTLDARGLQMMAGNRVSDLAVSAVNDNPFTSGNEVPVSLRTDIQANARELAKGTGGFAMDNSNDLRAPLRRVMEDVHAHYEATYTPLSQTLDGRFRTIDVKILRAGLTIQSRKGYYALPQVNGEPVTVYEMAGLRALNAHPVPHAFDFHFSALDLGRTPEGAQYEAVFTLPAKSVRFEKDGESGRMRVHVACLALVKRMAASPTGSAGGEPETVVAKVSKDLPYSVPAARRADFEAGMITLSVPLILPAGRYHVEAALMDIQASTASTARVPLIVEEPVHDAQVSDFVWVRSVHPLDAAQGLDETNPFDTPYGLLTPDLSGTFPVGRPAAFFFRIFNSTKAPLAQMVISHDGIAVRNIALTLPPPASDGTVSFLGEIPVSGLAAGRYEIGLTIRSGSGEVSRLTELVLTGQ